MDLLLSVVVSTVDKRLQIIEKVFMMKGEFGTRPTELLLKNSTKVS